MYLLKSKKVLIISSLLLLAVITVAIGLYNRPEDIFVKSGTGYVVTNGTANTGNMDSSAGLYQTYDNYDEADQESNLVIIGDVINVISPIELVTGLSEDPETHKMNPISHVSTVSEIKIDKVIKGNIKKGDVIKVKQLGGISKEYSYFGEEYFKIGERRMFFLATYENSDVEKHGYGQVPASPINPSQGSILIKQGKTVRTNKLQFINNDIQEDILVKEIEEKVKMLNKDSKGENENK